MKGPIRQPAAAEGSSRLGASAAVIALVIAIGAAISFVPTPSWLTGAEPVAAAAPGTGLTARPAAAAPAPASAKRPQPLWGGRGHRVAKLRKGEQITIHASPGGRKIDVLGDRTEFGSRRVLSVLDRRGGWLEVTVALFEDNRTAWIRADRRSLRFETTPLSLHADLSKRTLELQKGSRTVRKVEISVGAPGSETPTGRFAVTDVLVGGVNPVYGCCVLALSALQDDLPESWSGGNRMAIHGTPTNETGTASSLGCLRTTEEDLRALVDSVPVGTPVFIEP